MPEIVEIIHKKDNYMFFLVDFGGKQIECGSSWVPESQTLRYEMSSMFGCICDCAHCEYSYNYQSDLEQNQLEEQLTLLKETSIAFLRKARRIVISFCRMGEPTLNDSLLPFIKKVWSDLKGQREKLVFEIPTVAPELGTKFLVEAKKFAAIDNVKIRPVVTVHAIKEEHRKNTTGLEMIEMDKLAFLLNGWKARPIVLMQPIETGLIVSWDVKKIFGSINLSFSWRHIYGSLPITLRNHKIASYRGHYDNHIKFVTKGLKEKANIVVVPYDKPYHGISYSDDLDPGQYFSLLMKENLVRAVARCKVVS